MALNGQTIEVLACYSNLSDQDVQDWKAGPLTVGLSHSGELIVLTIRDGVTFGDAPYHPVAAGRDVHTLPLPDPNRYALTFWNLLEAETGRIRAIRQATFSPPFVAELNKALARALGKQITLQQYNDAVERYLNVPSSELVRRAVITETLGVQEPVTAMPAGQSAFDTHLTDVQRRFPALDSRVQEVLAEALARGEGRFEERAGEAWWIDPLFGDDVPVGKLGYDDTFGMVDRRSSPEPGQA